MPSAARPAASLLLLAAAVALAAASATAPAASLREIPDEAADAAALVEAAATVAGTMGGTQVNSASDMSRAFLTVAPHGMNAAAYQAFITRTAGVAAIPHALAFATLDTDRNGLLTVDEFTRAFWSGAAATTALPHTTHTSTTVRAADGTAHTTHTSTTAAAGHHAATTTTATATAAGHHAAAATLHSGVPTTAHSTTTTTSTSGNGAASTHHTSTTTTSSGAAAAGAHAHTLHTSTTTANGVPLAVPIGTTAHGVDPRVVGGYNHNGVHYPAGVNPLTHPAYGGADGAGSLYGAMPTRVDWHAEANSKVHHTKPYRPFLGAHKVVLRRGALFSISLIGPATMNFDQIGFTVGANVVANIGRNGKFGSKTWGCKVRSVVRLQSGERRALYRVYIPSDAPIGEFELAAASPQFQRLPLGTFVVIFNAWSKFDDVYLKDVAYRTETVYADSGRIWFGDALKGEAGIGSMAWGYHQYEVLNIVLSIVREFVPPHERHDPARVARVFTWALNDAGHNSGVLSGRWDGIYSDGTKPTSWTNSRSIYQQWARTRQPVRYGQCWVFAGILTSAMRAVGIPCRPVTNFRSAHDSQPYDHVIELDEGESVWNYHVWNSVWMRRKDIGQGYQWNEIDATPQEMSEGRYQLGPASLHDVQNNRAHGSFDSAFVISEVNAHIWLRKSDYVAGMRARTTDFDTQDVGRAVSTARPGCRGSGNACRLDLTKHYKLFKDPFTSTRFAEADAGSVSFQHMFASQLTPERPVAGQPFTVRVRRSALQLSAPSSVHVAIVVESISYTGLSLGVIKQAERQCVLTPNAADPRNTCGEFAPGHEWVLSTSPEEYRARLGASTSVRVSVRITHINGEVHGLRQYVFMRQFTLVPGSHHMRVEAPARVECGRPFKVALHVTNPLHYQMTGVLANIDSPDINRVARFGNIPARSRVVLVTKPVSVSTPGVHMLSVSLDTVEYPDLYAGFTFEAVMPAGGYNAHSFMMTNALNARLYGGHAYDMYAAAAARGGFAGDKSLATTARDLSTSGYIGDSLKYVPAGASSHKVARGGSVAWR